MARRKLHRGIRYPRLQHDKITVRYDVPRRREHTGRPQRIVHHSDRSDGKGYPFVLFAITAPLPGGGGMLLPTASKAVRPYPRYCRLRTVRSCRIGFLPFVRRAHPPSSAPAAGTYPVCLPSVQRPAKIWHTFCITKDRIEI